MRLFIEKMVYGGYGLARVEDGLVFVKGAIKGEVVEAKLDRKKKGYSFASLSEVLEPSSLRVPTRCPHFGVCGGCDWQHISYEGQLELKSQILEDVFERIGGVKVAPELIAKGQPWAYRYRARFHSDHRGRLGFYKESTNDVVWIGSCPILVSSINDAKRALEELEAFEKGTEVSIRCAYGVDDILIYIGGELKRSGRRKLKELPFSLVENGRILKGKPYTLERWCNLDVRFSYNSFSQVNPMVAQDLYLFIVKELNNFEKIWYLYGGVGILAMLLALDGKEVKLIEANISAIKDAEENMRNHGLLGRVELVRGDVSRIFPSLLTEFEADAIVADPPREGMGKEVIEALRDSDVRKIVYVSCHPPALARDVRLLRDLGYELSALKWVDMFPQTSHIEAVGILCKGGG